LGKNSVWVITQLSNGT